MGSSGDPQYADCSPQLGILQCGLWMYTCKLRQSHQATGHVTLASYNRMHWLWAAGTQVHRCHNPEKGGSTLVWQQHASATHGQCRRPAALQQLITNRHASASMGLGPRGDDCSSPLKTRCCGCCGTGVCHSPGTAWTCRQWCAGRGPLLASGLVPGCGTPACQPHQQ